MADRPMIPGNNNLNSSKSNQPFKLKAPEGSPVITTPEQRAEIQRQEAVQARAERVERLKRETEFLRQRKEDRAEETALQKEESKLKKEAFEESRLGQVLASIKSQVTGRHDVDEEDIAEEEAKVTELQAELREARLEKAEILLERKIAKERRETERLRNKRDSNGDGDSGGFFGGLF